VTRGVRVCRQPGCPNFQPCPTPGHEPEPWTGSTRRQRLPPNWARTRRRILRRDPTCYIEGCTAPSTEVDHRINNDDDSDANLAGICTPHHRTKSAHEGVTARNRKDTTS
jgi:5-methylcytosine-specific restriction protein A